MILRKIYQALVALRLELIKIREEGQKTAAAEVRETVRLGSLLHKTAHRRAITIKEFRDRARALGWKNTGLLTHETRVVKTEAEPIITDILIHE